MPLSDVCLGKVVSMDGARIDIARCCDLSGECDCSIFKLVIGEEAAGWIFTKSDFNSASRELFYTYRFVGFGLKGVTPKRPVQRESVAKIARLLEIDIKTAIKNSRATIVYVNSITEKPNDGFSWVLEKVDNHIEKTLTATYLGRIKLRFKQDLVACLEVVSSKNAKKTK